MLNFFPSSTQVTARASQLFQVSKSDSKKIAKALSSTYNDAKATLTSTVIKTCNSSSEAFHSFRTSSAYKYSSTALQSASHKIKQSTTRAYNWIKDHPKHTIATLFAIATLGTAYAFIRSDEGGVPILEDQNIIPSTNGKLQQNTLVISGDVQNNINTNSSSTVNATNITDQHSNSTPLPSKFTSNTTINATNITDQNSLSPVLASNFTSNTTVNTSNTTDQHSKSAPPTLNFTSNSTVNAKNITDQHSNSSKLAVVWHTVEPYLTDSIVTFSLGRIAWTGYKFYTACEKQTILMVQLGEKYFLDPRKSTPNNVNKLTEKTLKVKHIMDSGVRIKNTWTALNSAKSALKSIPNIVSYATLFLAILFRGAQSRD